MQRARLIDAATLPVYDLGIDHPFARDRQRPLFDLLRSSGLVAAADFLPWRPATAQELATVHDPEYIAVLAATSAADPPPAVLRNALRFGLGGGDNPIAPGQHQAAAAACGATLACVDAVLDGTCNAAFNPAGGLHHAMPHSAAGFCLYNDLAIGIRRALQRGASRVLYVDFDVHHGDGVEWTFRRDPQVLTISFHETPDVRYPGTGRVTDVGEGPGRGFALNVPLEPGTADASFLECVERVLLPAAAAFRPDLVVSQHGCDTHREDPLATLECTTRKDHGCAVLARAAAEHCGGRWVATGGGGYQPVRVLPRAFGLVWSVLADRPVHDPIDAGFRQRWQHHPAGPPPDRWFDEPEPRPQHERAAARNRRTVDELQGRLGALLAREPRPVAGDAAPADRASSEGRAG